MLHDEFLYDESLKSNLSHIYIYEPYIYFLLLMSIECGQAV